MVLCTVHEARRDGCGRRVGCSVARGLITTATTATATTATALAATAIATTATTATATTATGLIATGATATATRRHRRFLLFRLAVIDGRLFARFGPNDYPA
jgi:hypothetical protein